MGLGTRRKGRDFLMPHMDPVDFALSANRVRETIETVADDAVNAFYAGGGEGLCELIGNGPHGFHPRALSKTCNAQFASTFAILASGVA